MTAASVWSDKVRTLAKCTLDTVSTIGVQYPETRDREAVKLWQWYVEIAIAYAISDKDEILKAAAYVNRKGVRGLLLMVRGMIDDG